jgi:hypothetical protein
LGRRCLCGSGTRGGGRRGVVFIYTLIPGSDTLSFTQCCSGAALALSSKRERQDQPALAALAQPLGETLAGGIQELVGNGRQGVVVSKIRLIMRIGKCNDLKDVGPHYLAVEERDSAHKATLRGS